MHLDAFKTTFVMFRSNEQQTTLFKGIADVYRKQHPSGSATVTQFQPRPQLLVREQLTHRPTAYTYAEAVFSPVLPAPTPESLRFVKHIQFSSAHGLV